MLAHSRRAREVHELLAVEAHRRRRPVPLAVHLGYQPPVHHLRVAERLLQVVHRTDARLQVRQPVQPFVAGVRREQRLHLLVRRRVPVELLVDHLRRAHRLAQRTPELRLQRADRQVLPVAGPIHAVARKRPGQPHLPALRQLPGG